jgi:hypothetical protein
MRQIALVLSSIVILTTNALAGGKAVLPQIPEQCRTWSDDAARAKTDQLRDGAELSLANCLLEDRVGALTLTGDDASLKALAEAFKPTVAILDQLMQGSDPTYQILAAQAKGDLYDAMVVRIRNTGRSNLEPQLAPWSQAAAVAYAEAVRVAKLHPDLIDGNPVVASAVRWSQSHLQAGASPPRK